MRPKAFIFLLTYFQFIAILHGAAPENDLALKQQKINLSLGLSLYEEERYAEALILFQDFLDIYPDSPYTTQVYETMASIYEKTQQYMKALDIYRKLYQDAGLTTQGIKYYYNQGRLLYEMGELDEARKIFEDIIMLSPDSPYAKKAKIQLQLTEVLK